MAVKILVDREIELWRERCPLELWFKGRGKRWTVQMIADRCVNGKGKKMSKAAVYAWLHGKAVPRSRALHTLRTITGITLDAWLRWFDSRPLAGEQSCDSTSTEPQTADNGEP